VIATLDFRLLAPDDLHVLERTLAEAAAGDGGARSALTGLGEGEVQQAILRERRAGGHIEQAALTADLHAGQAVERLRQLAAPPDDPHAARTLRPDHPAVRAHGKAPGMLQVASNRDHLEFTGLGLRGGRARRLGSESA